MVAPIVAAKRAKIETDNYDPDFSMRWMQKDLHLASISGYEAGVPLPVVNATKESYRQAMREGYADRDYGSIYAFFNADHDGQPAAALASVPPLRAEPASPGD
jgi:3-hydroxyisobutyrate dehydrogenase/glyoxylate/succinic semialdehyde reductase